MNTEELFHSIPDLLLRSVRKQMLMGTMSARSVRIILEPLLSDFYTIMLRLPHELQVDLEDILRIYPDVARQFDLVVKPPLLEALRSLAVQPPGSRTGIRALDTPLDCAAEEQTNLAVTGSPLHEGQGFFETERGNPVYIEFSYREGEKYIHFMHKPEELRIGLFIRGIHILDLAQEKPEGTIAAQRFLETLRGDSPELTLEAREA